MGALGLPQSGHGGQRAGCYGLTAREAEARLVARQNRGGGLGRCESRDGRGPVVGCRGSEGAVVLVRWFGGDDDPGQTSHAALSSGRGLRGTVQALIMGTAPEYSGW